MYRYILPSKNDIFPVLTIAVADPDPFGSVLLFPEPDPFLSVPGSGANSKEHNKINWQGNFNSVFLLVGSWQTY